MKVRTAISKIDGDDMLLRGESHAALIKEASFSDAIFLLVCGKRPTKAESAVFNAILIAIIDHGAGTASALSSRVVASTGNPLNAAVAGGVLALGDYHGGAIEQAMEQLAEVSDPDAFVRESLAAKRTIYGYGHKLYKEADPRVTLLKEVCKRAGFSSPFIDEAFAIEAAIERAKGKRLVLNVDGFIAACLLEMGFPPEAGKGLFIIGRTPGLVAHAVEEHQREKPVRRLSEADVEYDGA